MDNTRDNKLVSSNQFFVSFFLLILIVSMSFEELFSSLLGRTDGASISPLPFSIGHEFYTTYFGIHWLVPFLVFTIMSKSNSKSVSKWFISLLIFSVLMLLILVSSTSISFRNVFVSFSAYLNVLIFFFFARSLSNKDTEALGKLLKKALPFFLLIVFFHILITLLVPRNILFIPFYDGLTQISLGAVLIGLVATSTIKDYRIQKILMLLSIVLIWFQGERRTALFAICMSITTLIFLSPKISRIFKYLTAFLFLFLLFVTRSFISNYVELLIGGNASFSDNGHFSDLVRGFDYCRNSNAFKFEIFQQNGLVSRAESLYIHNELLFNCVKFGKVSFFFGLSIFAYLVILIIKTGRMMEKTFLDYVAFTAILCTLIYSLFFPVISANVRWQIMFGVSLGLLTTRQSSKIIRLLNRI